MIYYYLTKISPYKPQEIVSSMYCCRNKALLEKASQLWDAFSHIIQEYLDDFGQLDSKNDTKIRERYKKLEKERMLESSVKW